MIKLEIDHSYLKIRILAIITGPLVIHTSTISIDSGVRFMSTKLPPFVLTKTVGVLNCLIYEYPLAILKTLYDTLFLPHLNYDFGAQKLKVFIKYKKELCVSFQTINLMHTLNLFVEQNDF